MSPYAQTHDGTYHFYGSAQVTPYGSPIPPHCYPNQEMVHQGLNPRQEWQASLGSHYIQRLNEGHYLPKSNMSESTYVSSHDTPGIATVASSRQTTSSPPPGKPARRSKSKKLQNIVNLTEPLSQSTKDSAIPVKDMYSFVHRSAEERMKEKEKKNGYIVRPMNAFMLYRSAYADRAKAMFDQNNHQVVSKATGQSWRLETKDVQDYYKQLSEVERDNHQKAWPDYKFSPSKTSPAVRKRKGGNSDTDDEAIELDNSDYDWTPSGSRKPKVVRNISRKLGRPLEVTVPHRSPPQYDGGSVIERQYYSIDHTRRPTTLPLQIGPTYSPDIQYQMQGMQGQVPNHLFMDGSHYPQVHYTGPYLDEPRHGVPGGGSNDLYDFEVPGMMGEPQMMLDPALVLDSQQNIGAFNENPFGDFDSESLARSGVRKTEGPLQVIGEDIGFLDAEFSGSGSDALKKWVEETNSRVLDG